jgi:hypothetical protein
MPMDDVRVIWLDAQETSRSDIAKRLGWATSNVPKRLRKYAGISRVDLLHAALDRWAMHIVGQHLDQISKALDEEDCERAEKLSRSLKNLRSALQQTPAPIRKSLPSPKLPPPGKLPKE